MLKNIVVRSKTIEFEGESFVVKGLTIENVVRLLADHGDIVNDLFSGTMSINSLLSAAPGFAASMIANAAGEPDAVEQASMLPVGTQVEVLEAVWDMTVPNEASLKKLVARLQDLGISNQK